MEAADLFSLLRACERFVSVLRVIWTGEFPRLCIKLLMLEKS